METKGNVGMNSVTFKMSLVITMLGVSCAVSAVGIPIVDPAAPIKISESSSYSCDRNGNALDEGKPMHYENQIVTCHNDNLLLNGKVLSFMDMLGFIAKDAASKINKNYEMTHNAGTEDIQPVEFFDNGIATYIKFKPESKMPSIDGKEVPAPPNFIVFYVNKSGKEVVALGQVWNTERNILSFPFVANEWRIRSGDKVIVIRKVQ